VKTTDDGRRTTVYLGLGSNMGDREAHLRGAIEELERLDGTRVLRKSPLYVSKPWGKVDQPDFLNMVVEVTTQLDAHSLLRECKRIEKEAGRVPGERWGPRPLDIDILLFGDAHLDSPDLLVPHPRLWDRAFVLRPLADLRPDLTAPDGTPIKVLLERESIASQGVWPYEAQNVIDDR
jgi:2-amino-4-hydroxy-6-hydroxymethyldihydropteridine diphosphokinase